MSKLDLDLSGKNPLFGKSKPEKSPVDDEEGEGGLSDHGGDDDGEESGQPGAEGGKDGVEEVEVKTESTKKIDEKKPTPTKSAPNPVSIEKVSALANFTGVNAQKIKIREEEESTKGQSVLVVGDDVYRVLTKQDYAHKGPAGFRIYDGTNTGKRFFAYFLGKLAEGAIVSDEKKTEESED